MFGVGLLGVQAGLMCWPGRFFFGGEGAGAGFETATRAAILQAHPKT